MIKYIFIFFLLSNILSQECGDNECSELENFTSCIDDCPITVENIVWIDDIPIHVDEDEVTVSINSIYLENIFGMQFEFHYDYSVLELNVDNCSDGYNVDCELASNSASYFTNTSIPGVFQAVAFSAMPFNIDDQFLNIKFDIIGDLGDSSSIVINEFIINGIDVTSYTLDGIVTIGNFGCMDQGACNYSSDATFDDGSCAFELDCLGECGGGAILDDNDNCCSVEEADCLGICNGTADFDECGICNGNMFIDEYGFYTDGTCDCSGLEPYIYCIDNDGDLQGDPNSSFLSCIEINQESLVPNCTDADDSCIGNLDDCGICDGSNLAQDCFGTCFGNAILDNNGECCNFDQVDCEGLCNGSAILDECGECNGEGIAEDACDCLGTMPTEFCIDNNNDGISDIDPLLLCDAPPVSDFVVCQTLGLNDILLQDFNLLSVYPNPFNPSLSINYLIDSFGLVTIDVLDINGRYIDKIISEIHTPGEYYAVWLPGNHIPSGIYILQMNSLEKTFIQKVNYIK